MSVDSQTRRGSYFGKLGRSAGKSQLEHGNHDTKGGLDTYKHPGGRCPS